MTKQKDFYRVSFENNNFSTKDFVTLEGAREYVENHRNPNKPLMTEENKNYWREVSKGMKIHFIQRTEIINEIK